MIMEYKIMLAAALLALGVGSYYFGPFQGKADNPVEECVEQKIKDETGLTIDLTPDEGEDNDK